MGKGHDANFPLNNMELTKKKNRKMQISHQTTMKINRKMKKNAKFQMNNMKIDNRIKKKNEDLIE